MASWWPWKRDASTASFEKTLSTLSAKIADTQSRLDRVRASSRRVKVLCSMYLSFAYVVYTIVLFLVVGYKNIGVYEWTGVAGGPVLIYATWTLLAVAYNYRIDSFATRLQEQQKEREKTIQQLKDITKYDSTMELIEKYGGTTAEGKSGRGKKGKRSEQGNQQAGGDVKRKMAGSQPATPNRTNMAPPPTANIQRRDGSTALPSTPSPHPPPNPMEPSAEFAPNADFSPQTTTTAASPLSLPPAGPATAAPLAPAEPRWYDRILDLLLGEDETASKNRFVLICGACRLVNGQAPPGTRSLADVGRWRCMGCQAMNGEEAPEPEGQRIVREVLKGKHAAEADEEPEEGGKEADEEADGEEEEEAEEAEDGDGPAAAVKRRRGKGKK